MLSAWRDGTAQASGPRFRGACDNPWATPTSYPLADRIAVFDDDDTLSGRAAAARPGVFCDRSHPGVGAAAPRMARSNSHSKPCSRATWLASWPWAWTGSQALVMATHAGMSTEPSLISCATGLRPHAIRGSTGPYTDLVYQPMLDVLALLRANDFKTFIVSGGGIEFMRTFSETVRIPPSR